VLNPTDRLTSAAIRAARIENPALRERDLAETLGIPEGQLIAAHTGQTADLRVTRISAQLDQLMPAVARLGEVMALTRNESCVIEKVGVYDDYRTGAHAAMILNPEIDMRMFPAHWAHGFAVEKTTDRGTSRSLQVFDKAGDAVHKVYLRDASVLEEWDQAVESLQLADQSDQIDWQPRKPVEAAKTDPAKTARLQAEWDQMTDTHQFLGITRKLKLNRLGAYRMVDENYAKALSVSSVEALLNMAAQTETPLMVFVGNMGCIEIHTGPVKQVKTMGPWLNVLDPGFNLHLRHDHIAEVWLVRKNTRRGQAISVEAFAADGLLIAQFFGVLRNQDAADKWADLVTRLEPLEIGEMA
jgi:putative hemin transport protein